MQKYRIGRLINPWKNKTPPIRGGAFSDPDETNSTASNSDSDLSDATTICASSTCSDSGRQQDNAKPRNVTKQVVVGDITDATPSKRSPPLIPHRDTATEALIQKTIQGEVDDNIRDYPSLDSWTQREIENRYRALHDRVKNEGFYECHYREYAKELARYLSIFALFMTTLLHGWYWTSACLLGLFWVSDTRPKARILVLTIT